MDACSDAIPTIQLRPILSRALPQPMAGLLEKPARCLLAVNRLNQILARLPLGEPLERFLEAILGELGIDLAFQASNLDNIPDSGRLIVTSNHPFGLIEGVILGHILRQRRRRVRLMANHLLRHVPGLDEMCIYVDPFQTQTAPSTNLTPLRQAIRHLREDGVLVIFPAGEVASLRPGLARVTDPEWSPTAARLVQQTRTPVLPVHFSGRNSGLFQALGLVHPRLRTWMLPRELLKQTKTTIGLRLGSAIDPSDLTNYSERELTAYLRARSYLLDPSPKVGARRRSRRAADLGGGLVTHQLPVAKTENWALIRWEVDRLAREQELISSGHFSVFYARAPQIPHLLREIGRLREITFRAVGEGSGRNLDLDRFDRHYIHLVLWDWEEQRLAGGYRLGLVGEILPKLGPKGLYTSTLFKYHRRFLDGLTEGVELGRSFVRQEYQRSYSSLLLLWKGIGRMVARRPEIRYLFGPVSIDAGYQAFSRRLIMEFLARNTSRRELGRLVKPRRPVPAYDRHSFDARRLASTLTGLESLVGLVADLEQDRPGVPVILRQYLKLGAVSLGFNLDPAFANVLDVLLMVDLLDLDPAVLTRYLGRDQAVDYLHRRILPAAANA